MSVQLWYRWAPTVLLLGCPDNSSPILPSASFHTFLAAWREGGGYMQEFFIPISFLFLFLVVLLLLLLLQLLFIITIIIFFLISFFLEKVPTSDALPE